VRVQNTAKTCRLMVWKNQAR